MLETQNNYNFLQKRVAKKSDGSFKAFNSSFITNNYRLKINPKKCIIYQYDYEIYIEGNTKIADDSRLYSKIIKQNKKQLINVLGYIAHSGRLVFSYKKQPKTSLKCKIGGENILYEAVFTQVKQIDLRDLTLSDKPPDTKSQILQLLNITLKNKIRDRGLVQLGKSGKYFDLEPKIIKIRPQGFQGLNLMQGFKFTIVQMNREYLLQIDTCFRVMQQQNFLQQIKIKLRNMPQQKLRQQIQKQQMSVTASYGSYRNYRVVDIDFKQNPTSKFKQNNQIEISYKDYYLKNYKIKIADLQQPLIKVLLKTEKTIGKDGKIKKQQFYGYLIPQLVCMSGIKDSQASQFKIMQQLSKTTKLSPAQKIEYYQDAKQILNQQQQLIKIGNSVSMDGYLLNLPQLKYERKQTVKPDRNGKIKQLTKLYKTNQFKDDQYLFVYSIKGRTKQQQQYNRKDADKAIDELIKSSKIYGIKFGQPVFLQIKYNAKPNVDAWIKKIGQQCNKYGNPKIVILFLDKNQESFYDQLKSYLINQIKVPSQVIKKKTFYDPKEKDKGRNPKGKVQSAASKLAIQMNVKVGCAAWKVQKNHPYFQNRNLLYAAITVSKGKNGTYLSFVGNINNDCTDFYATCKKVNNASNIPVEKMKQIFKSWIKSYRKIKTNELPDTILIYREGLNEKQAQQMISLCQIPALEYMVNGISKLFEVQNYKPECQIILVNKKINQRFFKQVDNSSQNPSSGSIITDSEDCKTFYLVPQFVTQGTCTPTSFTTLLDQSNITQEALMTFTYQQCFNYYNWEGAVRVPSALQYANKLAKLCSENLKEQIQESNLNNLLFFL